MNRVLSFLGALGILTISAAVIFGFLQYEQYLDNQPKPRSIVYACPDDESVKCYELQADFDSGCNDEGQCSPTFETLYFLNEGHVSLKDCTELEAKRFHCYEDDPESNKGWNIENTGRSSVEKYLPQKIK
jgi:hypothetical protein